jgi:hypothetical protein
MLHEGNVYFEHCYGADFDPKVRPEQREACWQAWLADYTRHQPAHRIDYAMRRVEGVQAGELTLRLPGLPGGQSEAPTDPVVARLVATRGAKAGAEVETLLEPPNDRRGHDHEANGCSETCASYQQQCEVACPTSDQPGCRSVCEREHQICLNGCY